MTNPTQHEAAERVSVDEVERIILNTEPPSYSDAGDKVWTRRMATALAERFNEPLALRAHDAGQAGVVVKRHDLGTLLKHAFLAGRGLNDGDKISEADLSAWVNYDPGDRADYTRICEALSTLPAPTPSLFGDALAAAGQSIGMSVTRVHPEPEKVWIGTDKAALAARLEAEAAKVLKGGPIWGEGETVVIMQEAAAELRTSIHPEAGGRVVELKMTSIGEALPVRDELRGEQTILTYNEKVGTWDLCFYEAGWDDFDNGFALGVTHWLDITYMWPGVIAQVALLATPPVADARRVEELERALKPFADWVIKVEARETSFERWADEYRPVETVMLGDFRRALAALKGDTNGQ